MQPVLLQHNVPCPSQREIIINKISMSSGDKVRPTHTDVLLGRGVNTNRHSGNTNFRQLVSQYVSEYSTSTKTKKVAITRSIVEHIQTRLTPPGRFLEKDQASGAWKEVETKRAHEKTAQALRDGAAPLRKRLSVEITSDPLFLLDDFTKGDVNSRPAKKPRKSVSAEHLRLPRKGKKEQVHDNSNQQWLSTRGAPLISPSPSPVTSVNEFDLSFHLLDPRGDPFPIDVVDMLDDDILRLWDTC